MSIYDHFRKEERPFVDQVMEWKQMVSERGLHKLSDFLDPREQFIVSSLVGHDSDVCYSFLGGHLEAERKRVFICPTYLTPVESDFQLVAYEILYPHRFVKLEHKDILGSLMGLGLKREKFGDIYIQEEKIQIVLASEVSSFVETNLQNVGRASIQLKEIELQQLFIAKEEWVEKSITASSLRLDLILSEIYQTSRSKIASYIDGKKVKVNWKTVDQGSYQLQQGDNLSVRGLGRSKLLAIDGKTKKDKWRMIVGVRK